MEILGKLFGTPARVKILRLFLFNPEDVFETAQVRRRCKLSTSTALSEIRCLAQAGIIRQKIGYKTVTQAYKHKKKGERKKMKGWALNEKFLYREPLKQLLINKHSFAHKDVVKRFRMAGAIKVLILAGIFIQKDDSRVDILIVGDYLKKGLITKVLRILESEIGKELRYGVLETKDFLYRLDIYDKFVRDILDYPHEKLIDKIGLKRT